MAKHLIYLHHGLQDLMIPERAELYELDARYMYLKICI